MSPLQLAQKLSSTKQDTLGIHSIAITSSSDTGCVFLVSFNHGVSSAVFLTRVADQFPEYNAALSKEECLTVDNISITPISSAPGRCYFSVSYVGA
jgi:hypothetical protein